MSKNSKIFLVDDEPQFLDLLSEEFQRLGYRTECFQRAEDFVARGAWTEIGCLITDLSMPGMNGRELVALCKKHDPVLSVVVYSSAVDVVSTVGVMRSGAFYVFEKGRPIKELVSVVEEGVDASAQRATSRKELDATRSCIETLTAREREVMLKIASGLSNREIGQELGISVNTVEIHRSRVMRKMATDSVATLTRALAAIGL